MALVNDVKAKVAKVLVDVTAFRDANSGGASDADLKEIDNGLDAIDAIVAPPAAPPAAS